MMLLGKSSPERIMSTTISATPPTPPPPKTADDAAGKAKQQLAQLQRTYQSDLNNGQAASSLTSLSKQITALAKQAGVNVRLPTATPAATPTATAPTAPAPGSSGKINAQA
jgi:hypothetical protein